MNEYRVDVRVKNNLLLSKIESKGYSSIAEFCNSMSLSDTYLYPYINMRKSIYCANGSIRPSILKICEILNCLPEELFTAAQAEAELKTNKRSYQVNEAEVKFFLENTVEQKSLEQIADGDLLNENLYKVLKTLTPREQEILKLRFGLDGETEHKLSECAEKFGVTKERLRQIEQKAFRKLRHPIRAELIMGENYA